MVSYIRARIRDAKADVATCRHLMTGTGAYFYITWGIWLRHCLNGAQEEYDLDWPRIWSLPEVVRKEKKPNGGAQHDAAKKNT